MGNKKKTRSGPNIPESQRNTVAIKLRLQAEVAKELRERASTTESTISDYVTGLIKTEEKDSETEELSNDNKKISSSRDET